ncbi:hypothetical protein [uncultured Corynebacterium sp.]|uniref:hypothetical protein n=1 Tax=uncultured Corynebacterium sp. TaxID=159447 RepID=UPI0025D65C6C|nr:hypothetical protein [uncultured Corynebacterium sp.]
MKKKTRSSNRRAFLTGVGSLLDLQGETTYRRMQEMMPAPKKTSVNQIFVRAGNRLSLENKDIF